jgi:hypothetical protein
MADALSEFNTLRKDKVDTGQVGAPQFFGTAADTNGNYLYRMAGAVLGIYGNTAAEAMYPSFANDSAGAPLTGANHYTFRFAPDHLPPVNAFWSLTMYELPQSLPVANPLQRYLINSPMLTSLVPDPDGGYTFDIQNTSPGIEKQSNWLPAPNGGPSPGIQGRGGADSARTPPPRRRHRSCRVPRSYRPQHHRALRATGRIRRSPRPRPSSR